VALRRVAGIGDHFTLLTAVPEGTGRPLWLPTAALYGPGGPELLAPLVAAVQARIGSPERRVAASLLYQGFAARLFSPVVACVALARQLPALDPAALHWRYVDGRPIDLLLQQATGRHLEPGMAAGDVAALIYRGVVEDHLLPLAAALRSTVRISEPLLWGNAASALAGAARMLAAGPAGQAAHRISAQLLDQGVLRGTVTWQSRPRPLFVRRSCCLYYRVPDGGTCLDCVLNGAATPGGRRRSPRGSSSPDPSTTRRGAYGTV
jgi:ferric iron reductase protein FhuF